MTQTDLLPFIEDWTGPNIGLQYQAYANEYGSYSGQSVSLSIPAEPATELSNSVPHIVYFTKGYLNLAEQLEVSVNFDPARVEQVQNLTGIDEDVFALSFPRHLSGQVNFPVTVNTRMLESLLSKSSIPEEEDRIAYELMKHSFAGKIRYRYDSLHCTALYVAFLRKTRNSNFGASSDYSYEEITAEIIRNGWN